jgi:vacuolar protein sorting-associated protein 45
MIGLVYTQSEILANEVFLVERIDKEENVQKAEKASMPHLKCVVFVRPTPKSIEGLKSMLKKPKFKEFHVFFSNVLEYEDMRVLAEADEHELIRQLQEAFADYYAVDGNVFTLNSYNSRTLYQPQAFWLSKEKEIYRRNMAGLMSILLSLKKRPTIRYQGASDICKMLAHGLNEKIDNEGDLFYFRNDPSCLLLIVDRREDPVTPLLMPWTYQAMVHELIGIKNNRVDLSASAGIKLEQKEVVLASETDHFFKGSMYLNFGDLGASVKELVSDFSRKKKSTAKLDTIEDMQRFVEHYPEFQQLAGTVSKHVALMSEMSKLVDARGLLGVSEVAQELACVQDHSAAVEKLLQVVESAKVLFEDKLRLATVYALRYEEDSNQTQHVKKVLREQAASDAERNKVKGGEVGSGVCVCVRVCVSVCVCVCV